MKKALFFLFVLSLFLPATSFAFCGFFAGSAGKNLYNDATSVILMRDGTTTTLSMQNDYAGPAEDFAMVIPVPQVLGKDDVKTLDSKIFDKVDKLAAPRLVEYWEANPCRPRVMRKKTSKGLDSLLSGTGNSFVKVKAKFNVDEYQIVILSAKDSTSLETWLKDNKYAIPKKAAKYFQPYIQSGMYFFVAKVDIKKVKKIPGGGYRLSPIRFTYESDDFVLPIRLGLINSRGSQDLLVHILADNQRYEAGNYPSVTIPTNIELKTKAKDNFGVFYSSLFDAVLKKTPKAVVTEYSWQAKNCDPCPGKPLNRKDLESLGADRIDANLTNFVLTRLHTRYKAGEVGEDLIFRAAPPIVGGRESVDGKAAQRSDYNQFQGRYIIRHRWKKKVACKRPRYKHWKSGKPKASKISAYTRSKKNAYRRFSKGKIQLRNRLKQEKKSE